MDCKNCDHYKLGYLYNACDVAEMECFMPIVNCSLVNADGSINYDDEFFIESIVPDEIL